MRQLKSGERLKERPVVTIGTFDGIHRGHQALFRRARDWAKELGTSWTVVTFDHPPAMVLKKVPEPYEITPLAEKLRVLESLGVPLVAVLEFNQDLARLPADAFLSDVVEGWLNARAVVEGETFTFGARALGNPVTLKAWGQRHRVAVDIVARQGQSAGGWSSSRVREAIRGGHLALAERILGRPFAVSGTVVAGDGRGRQIGVPTANIVCAPSQLMPPPGVYAGYLVWGGAHKAAIANWGAQPTFGGQTPRLEVHVLDFEGDLRGEIVTFEIRVRVRDVAKFAGPAELVRQIREDIETARRLISAPAPSTRG
jgi:riboflavin kinase/FMN adenylyltransferase